MEGGYFIETYRTQEKCGNRSLSTAIYFLLTDETFSEMHRLPGDEMFHFYFGDPVEHIQLFPDGSGKIITIGNDIVAGHEPQVLVSGGVWQGSRLVEGGRMALMGTTMSPGFEFKDYESGDSEALVAAFPEFKDLILALSRQDKK